MAAPMPDGGCPSSRSPQNARGPLEYGLAKCTKYNISPPRGIPEKGEEICDAAGSNPPIAGWTSRLPQGRDPAARLRALVPRAARSQGRAEGCTRQDRYDGREFYCLQRNGQWIHDGEHDFPVGG